MSTKRGRKEKDVPAPPEKKSKGAKGTKSEAGKRGAGKRNQKDGDEEGGDALEPVRLLELPAIMPPPPCLFVEAILPPNESGSQYAFEGWSLNQLDGLASDFDHMSRVVADLEPLLEAELARIEAFEQEAGGLPGPVVIEGTAGGGQMMPPPPKTPLAGEADEGRGALGSSSQGGDSNRRGLEESFAEDDFEYPADDDDEDEYDYAASTTSGPKKPPAKNSFWGWMEQYFVRLGPQHLALLKETKVQGDPSFTIPKLGQHYSEKWGDSTADGRSDDKGRVGDVTARLLAALVSDADPSKKPKRRPDGEALKKSRSDEPATMVFNRELAAQIDDKLRGTLMSNGLISPSGLPPPDSREDDEICETIRSLQHQLQQQIKINNGMKEQIRPQVEKRMQMQQREEDAKREWDAALRRYEELMANKKKSKKSGNDE